VQPPTSGTVTIGSGVSNPSNPLLIGGNSTLSWDISNNGTNYTYIYTITNNPTGVGNVSFAGDNILFLQTGANVDSTNYFNIISGIEGTPSGPVLFTNNNMGDEIPGNLYGVAFEFGTEGTNTVAFSSDLAPMWGNFASTGTISDNNGLTHFGSFNTNFLTDPLTGAANYDGYIPVPGPVGFVGVTTPEPKTILLLGTLLAGISFIKRRKTLKSVS
jgi:hypothetical protein